MLIAHYFLSQTLTLNVYVRQKFRKVLLQRWMPTEISIQAWRKQLTQAEKRIAELDRLFVKIYKAKHYQDLNSLTPDALRDMVSAIYVGAPGKSSGKRQQKIEIYYDGAGFIPLNLLMQRETA